MLPEILWLETGVIMERDNHIVWRQTSNLIKDSEPRHWNWLLIASNKASILGVLFIKKLAQGSSAGNKTKKDRRLLLQLCWSESTKYGWNPLTSGYSSKKVLVTASCGFSGWRDTVGLTQAWGLWAWFSFLSPILTESRIWISVSEGIWRFEWPFIT